jgi:hypothetical protein
MTQSNLPVDMVISVSLNGFTNNQLKTMLCEALSTMTQSQALALLTKIGMTPADLT